MKSNQAIVRVVSVVFVFLLITILFSGCGNKLSKEELKYIEMFLATSAISEDETIEMSYEKRTNTLTIESNNSDYTMEDLEGKANVFITTAEDMCRMAATTLLEGGVTSTTVVVIFSVSDGVIAKATYTLKDGIVSESYLPGSNTAIAEDSELSLYFKTLAKDLTSGSNWGEHNEADRQFTYHIVLTDTVADEKGNEMKMFQKSAEVCEIIYDGLASIDGDYSDYILIVECMAIDGIAFEFRMDVATKTCSTTTYTSGQPISDTKPLDYYL